MSVLLLVLIEPVRLNDAPGLIVRDPPEVITILFDAILPWIMPLTVALPATFKFEVGSSISIFPLVKIFPAMLAPPFGKTKVPTPSRVVSIELLRMILPKRN